MLNPLSMLRIQNMYGNPQAIQQEDNSQVMNDSYSPDMVGESDIPSARPQDPMQIQSRFQQLYQPQNTAQNNLSQILQQQPQREQPGKLRQIGSVLAGLGTSGPATYYNGQALGFQSDPMKAMQAQDQFANAPYYDKMHDWENKIKPAEYAANLERQSNTNERTAVSQQVEREIQQQKADENERAAKAREKAIEQRNKISEERANIAQQRADTYQKIARGGTIVFDKDGEGWMVNKDGTKEKLDLTKFTDKEKQEFKTDAALRLEHARAADASKLESQRQTGRAANIEKSGEIRKYVKVTPSGGNKPDTQKVVEGFNAKGESQGKTVTTTRKPGEAKQMTDPKTGHMYDTSTWSAKDIEEARKRGFK